MKHSFTPVILSGGSGTRLWPYSRAHYPKQLLSLVSENSLLQETVLRLKGLDHQPPVVICNDEHRFVVAEQLRSIEQEATIFLEPEGRNTAPAIALAALAMSNDDILLVLPADHTIGDVDIFHQALNMGLEQAANGNLVTFGITPTYPETGYGYIKAGEKINNNLSVVQEFVEKPNLDLAQQYLESGEYSWNSGMFLFQAKAYLDALKQHAPDIYQHCLLAYNGHKKDLDFIRVNAAEFARSPSVSIDYAVMEKAQNTLMVELDAQWSDIGSWSALWSVSPQDDHGNHIKGDVIAHDTKGCFVKSEQKLVATLGIENLVVVESDDAILVADKSRVQDVKVIVSKLQSLDRTEVNTHRKVHRPWGYYDSIENGKSYQVKRLSVLPGASLSLQKHKHRSEHWVVISGIAEVVNGDQTFSLGVNQSTYIPAGTVHRLSNRSDQPLEIIEVQTGDYLGEDDIERLEDVYSR